MRSESLQSCGSLWGAVREVMGSLRKALPELYTALIAERDAYMARSILSTGATKTV